MGVELAKVWAGDVEMETECEPDVLEIPLCRGGGCGVQGSSAQLSKEREYNAGLTYFLHPVPQLPPL